LSPGGLLPFGGFRNRASVHRLPNVTDRTVEVQQGMPMSYGPNTAASFLQAWFVDRILKGNEPADLPVQAPARFELVVILKPAKALGLAMPPSILADEMIE
jgi:putative ABC transport system substrate-binding protein